MTGPNTPPLPSTVKISRETADEIMRVLGETPIKTGLKAIQMMLADLNNAELNAQQKPIPGGGRFKPG